MPHPFCSPCCSLKACPLCLDGEAPAELELVFTGIIESDDSEPDRTHCGNCVATNSLSLVLGSFYGEEDECGWSYMVDPFGEPPLPCFSGTSISLHMGRAIDGQDPTHYYLEMHIAIGFDNADVQFLKDLGEDPPDCKEFDGVELLWWRQSSATGIGEWYCDFTGATATISAI